jgi:hypothetical protein
MNHYSAHMAAGVTAVSRDDWERLFPDEAEGWAYYAACEAAPLEGFKFEAITVSDGAGRVVAAAPVFRVNYRLDTPLQGNALRPVSEWLYRNTPRLVSLPVIGIGSPMADRCHLGFAPDLSADDRVAAVTALLQGLDDYAARERVPLVAIKDLRDSEAEQLAPAIARAGFSRISSLPVCVLDLPGETDAAYIASLSQNNRSTLRRKLKKSADVSVEIVRGLTGLEDKLYALYEQTRSNSRFDYGDFEQLSPDYFKNVIAHLGDRAATMLLRVNGDLLAFKLMFLEKDRVIDKFWGMRYPEGRDHNLFFIAWMEGVRFTLKHGAKVYQSGQTAYAQKVKLGSHLDKMSVYFRHRGRVTNRVFKTFAPLVAFDKMDPELKEIARWADRRAS